MPKGIPNKRYTPEFKKIVIETMLEEKLVEKPPGVRGPQPPEAIIGFGDMRVKSAKSLA